MTDNVNHPLHYARDGMEAIDAIEAMTSRMSGCYAPHAGNVMKYLWRFEYKNGLEDIDKGIWYFNRLRGIWVRNHP